MSQVKDRTLRINDQSDMNLARGGSGSVAAPGHQSPTSTVSS